MSNKLLDDLAKAGLWPRNRLSCALGSHPTSSGEPGSRSQQGSLIVTTGWRGENPGTGTGIVLGWGTEGPTNHLQGAPSWHSENIMATGTGTHLVWGSGKPLGVTATLKGTELGKCWVRLESGVEGGSGQNSGQEVHGAHP